MLRTLYLLIFLAALALTGCNGSTPPPTADDGAATPPLENPSPKSFQPSPPPP